MFKPYFEPQELTFLAAVLEKACLDAGAVDDNQRVVVAARIVKLAQTSEADFETLRKDATWQNFNSAFRYSQPESRALQVDFAADCFDIVNSRTGRIVGRAMI
jgi:hypothetical protein